MKNLKFQISKLFRAACGGLISAVLLVSDTPAYAAPAAVPPEAGKSASGLLFEWDSISLAPFAAPLTGRGSLGPSGNPSPIRLILSPHRNEQDAELVLDELRGQLAGVSKQTPLVVWIECAQPVFLPKGLSEFRRTFPDFFSGSGAGYEALLQEPPAPEIRSKLEAIFRYAVAAQGDLKNHFLETADPFTQTLREGLDSLKAEGREVRIEIEAAPFESYLNDLRREIAGLLVTYWLHQNDERRAAASLALAYRYHFDSLDLRDEALAPSIAFIRRGDSNALHLVFRGSAHEAGMKRALAANGLRWKTAGSKKTTGWLTLPS